MQCDMISSRSVTLVVIKVYIEPSKKEFTGWAIDVPLVYNAWIQSTSFNNSYNFTQAVLKIRSVTYKYNRVCMHGVNSHNLIV